MVTNAESSFTVKDYTDDTYGARERGHLQDWQCLMVLRSGLPEGSVVIPESLKSQWHDVMVEPHPECRARHVHETQPWTTMTVRVFRNVDRQHVSVVQSLGKQLRTVRVPVRKETTVDYVRGMA